MKETVGKSSSNEHMDVGLFFSFNTHVPFDDASVICICNGFHSLLFIISCSCLIRIVYIIIKIERHKRYGWNSIKTYLSHHNEMVWLLNGRIPLSPILSGSLSLSFPLSAFLCRYVIFNTLVYAFSSLSLSLQRARASFNYKIHIKLIIIIMFVQLTRNVLHDHHTHFSHIHPIWHCNNNKNNNKWTTI